MTYQLENRLYRAGCDFTGVPQNTEGLYGCCYVAIPVSNIAAIGLALAELRVEAGLSQAEEFHGHKLPEWINLRVMQTALNAQALVFARFVDKVSGTALPPPRDFPRQLLDLTLRSSLAAAQANRISIDEDINGRAIQNAVRTHLCRLNRSLWNNARTKVTFASSEKDEFVQIADIFAYCLQAHFRKAVKTDEMRSLIAKISGNPRVFKPAIWTRGETE